MQFNIFFLKFFINAKIYLILLSFIPFCFASYDKVIYNNWILAGTSFDYENETYFVEYVKESNSTIVYFPEGIIGVLYASIENCTTQWIYTICQTKQKFEIGNKSVIPNIHEKNINVSLFLKINKTDVFLDISKNISPEKIFLTDEIIIKTEIKNKGLTDIYNASFTDSFSEEFIIQETNGCKIINNSVIWEGDLKKQKSFLCIYKIKPIKEGTFKNMATLQYFFSDKIKTKIINSTINISSYPLLLKINISNSTKKIGEPLIVNITIIALSDLFLKNIDIFLPEHYKILNLSTEATYKNNIISYKEKELKNRNTYTIYFKSFSHFVNNDKINISLEYIHNSILTEIKKNISINYTALAPEIQTYKIQNNTIARISNFHNISFKNITLKTENYSYVIDLLEKNRYKEIKLPRLEEEKINISYVTEYNQPLLYVYEKNQKNNTNEQKKIKSEKQEKKTITIQKEIIIFIIIVFVIYIIAYFLISMAKQKFYKTNLDKEIEKIKKQEKE